MREDALFPRLQPSELAFQMNTFDTRTAFLMIGLLYLLLPSIAWLTLIGQRSRPIDLCIAYEGGL